MDVHISDYICFAFQYKGFNTLYLILWKFSSIWIKKKSVTWKKRAKTWHVFINIYSIENICAILTKVLKILIHRMRKLVIHFQMVSALRATE